MSHKHCLDALSCAAFTFHYKIHIYVKRKVQQFLPCIEAETYYFYADITYSSISHLVKCLLLRPQ